MPEHTSWTAQGKWTLRWGEIPMPFAPTHSNMDRCEHRVLLSSGWEGVGDTKDTARADCPAQTLPAEWGVCPGSGGAPPREQDMLPAPCSRAEHSKTSPKEEGGQALWRLDPPCPWASASKWWGDHHGDLYEGAKENALVCSQGKQKDAKVLANSRNKSGRTGGK